MEIKYLLSSLQSSRLDMKLKFLIVIKADLVGGRGQVLTNVGLDFSIIHTL